MSYYAKGFCVKHYQLNRLGKLKREETPSAVQAQTIQEIAITLEAIPALAKQPAFTPASGRSVGIVRLVDQLGRVVLPIELRRALNIDISDSLEIFIGDQSLMLQKYEPGCLFCGNMEEVAYFKGKRICRLCLEKI